ncbi:hypothetical protein A3A35_02320 [Candidatus Kaiserbacteria bacterium RIFCSPLOWO2_01_FULL_51_21]|uniref:VOC domain-containing protein n=1 Tax=Candidatus Kaiserbacteria bacterium RIFCSPLOWO2_01_FULL_51_21 TaxID=1798508 RepID=A0A1F6EEJ3_9BACT|nr:MAG: hypothetical protein A3A35_02320 [Candidatus Kaiserbacteria bacterium RIFCSPLOWO2_01_FULL_51_21]
MNFAHIGLAVRDIKKSKEFYSKVLLPLQLSVYREKADSVHFGTGNGRTLFYIHTRSKAPGPVHIAFEADSRDEVGQFYKAAIIAGGKDNGTPGIRENYAPNYYAAFVLDPDGNNIEAICRTE